MHFLWLVLG
jgi:hypothetical protein